MKINIIAVGKLKETYFVEACEEYLKRLSRFDNMSVIEVPEAPQGKSIEEQCKIEGESILSKVHGYIIALDIKGKKYTSNDFAKLLQSKRNEGISEISFLIGGSNGLSDDVRNKADALMSFSDMTFPHQLFRVMLLEQIYRAETILNHIPYHK